MGEGIEVWPTFAMALAFCGVHLFVGRLRFLEVTPRSRWLSFAGGVAVGYVFLHVLPELAAHVSTFERAMGLDAAAAEGWIYALSLLGLALYYGVERAIVASRNERRADDTPDSGVFWLHIGATSVLVAIIAYLLNHREDASAIGLALYFGAMVLHFVTADFGTRSHHPEIYDARGRWVLAGATLAGWATGLLVEVSELVIGGLFAFVGGGIILLVLKEELPEERQSRFVPFAAGAGAYALLVLAERILV
ncbi:hypothetical protein [Alteriqipengyuania lutimaris]|uniref:Uncharacterized protein n=1 Tax=Alteriqipengyuania lutimaris TaxID=1538146 RepID=A0A395LJE9_9SPHN|nr:hypothetical protein [Alteriqipengyuania lutimaris]MBB3033900.1 hypothetical protein [Alteriqipengyuania lutimaris]RDS77136.1 hypothetical protein DL238_05590 [Alteriqipengyuania lutimaris]